MMQKNVAQRIKKIRMQNGLSQTELAAKCNVSKSLISKVESNKATMHLDLLINIADALEVKLFELFDICGENDKKKAIVVKEQERKKMVAGVPGKTGYRYYRLAGSEIISTFWMTVGIEAIKSPRWVMHQGYEFFYIVEGKIKLQFRDEEYLLRSGDTAYFDSRHEHRIIPIDCENAELIIIFADYYS